jgi:4-alpha-glucanotransferase
VPDSSRGRRAGVLLPLFSARSSRSWGIGEIGDVGVFASWLRDAGLRTWLMLPINEMSAGQHSPYSAMTAMAIDPIYISVPDVDDYAALGGDRVLDATLRDEIEAVRSAPRIEWDRVRALKMHALRLSFTRFDRDEWSAQTPRAQAFQTWVVSQAWWVEDYALFRALHTYHGERPWWEWEEGNRTHRPDAIVQARQALVREVRFAQYLQWVADEQWRVARREAGDVMLLGDLPFMVSADSADVWARQHAFDLTASIGVPPDAFSASGQDWGLPVYRWDVIADEDYEWIHQRARRYADLYGGFRVDHLVGFYRTYAIPLDGSPRYFVPDTLRAQLQQGETIMGMFGSVGARVFAEDLGTVPDEVRESLARLKLPGYRVLRWEREWHKPGMPFRDPLAFPPISVATTGTHDTDTLAAWWDTADDVERAAVLAMPWFVSLRSARAVSAAQPGSSPILVDEGFAVGSPFSDEMRDAFLELLFASGSEDVVVPLQDVFGWRDRVNVPATVDDRNWTWTLPWPIDAMASHPECLERTRAIASWCARYRRR